MRPVGAKGHPASASRHTLAICSGGHQKIWNGAPDRVRRLCRPAFESPETESHDHLDVAPDGRYRGRLGHSRPLKEQGKMLMSPWQRPCFGWPEPSYILRA